MSTATKLCVIGAGSATFSLGLVKDICLTASLDESHISFMNIKQERLEVVHKLAALDNIMDFEGHEEMREHFQWPKNWS